MDLNLERKNLSKITQECEARLSAISQEKKTLTAHVDARIQTLQKEIDKLHDKKEFITQDLEQEAREVYAKKSEAETKFARLFHGLEPMERVKAELADYTMRGILALEKRKDHNYGYRGDIPIYTTTRYSVNTGGAGLVKILVRAVTTGSRYDNPKIIGWTAEVKGRHIGNLGKAESKLPEDALKEALSRAKYELTRRVEVEKKRVIQEAKTGRVRAYGGRRRLY